MKWIVFGWVFLVGQSWGFDPMAPPGYQQPKSSGASTSKSKMVKPNYELRQIVIRKDRKSAVINGYIVNEGDYIKGARVTNISANEVVLQLAKKQTILRLKPNIARVRQ